MSYKYGGGIGGLLNVKQSGQNYSYLYNGKGSVTAVIDSAEATAATYTYDAFGTLMVKTGSLDQPFQFSTKRYDSQTGLVYYGYRFYSPALGRWLTRDPLGEAGGINLYGFVGANPVNWIDPFGLSRRRPRPPLRISLDRIEMIYSLARHKTARDETIPGLFPTPGWNDPKDAFRHCYASCVIALESNERTAAFSGWLNEIKGDLLQNQQLGEREMDEDNNQCGRELSRTAMSVKDCERMCKETNLIDRYYNDPNKSGYLY